MPERFEPVPLLASEAEERAYWESHDSTPHVDWSRAERVRRSTSGSGGGGWLSLRNVTVALERLVLFLFPTFVVLYSALFAGYRVGRRDVFALVASYLGIALAFVNDLTTQQTNVVLGTFLVLLSSISYAAYLIQSEKLIKRIGSIRYASLAALSATVGILAQFFLTTPKSTRSPSAM